MDLGAVEFRGAEINWQPRIEPATESTEADPSAADGHRPNIGPLVALFGARFAGSVLLRFPYVFLTAIARAAAKVRLEARA